MRILHYSLGFPPFRSGGLTKFCTDLMIEQQRSGHHVGLLWPGRYGFGRTRIKTTKWDHGIDDLEILNALPVPYDEGIVDPASFMQRGDADVFADFFRAWHPDVFHVHTLMGLHAAALDIAVHLGVRTVFSAHDFYPLCSRITLFRNGDACATAHSCVDCPSCNTHALSLHKMMLLQSTIYRRIKDTRIIRKVRSRHRMATLMNEDGNAERQRPNKDPSVYLSLREHYVSMLKNADIIHYNSSLCKAIYEEYVNLRPNVIVPVSHAGIQDRRVTRSYGSCLHMAYLGAPSVAKGFPFLLQTLRLLWEKKQNFRLHTYFDATVSEPFLLNHGRYSYDALPSILQAVDVVIVPSLLYETFGFVVVEALSYGVPVVVSSNVGAKEIIPPGAGIVFEAGSTNALMSTIDTLSPSKLLRMNEAILRSEPVPVLGEVSKALEDTCYLQR